MNYFNFARWSPDGRSFICEGTDFKGRQGIYRIDAQTGELEAIVVSAPGDRLDAPEWSHDGKRIYYLRRHEPRRKESSIVERDLASGRERELLHRYCEFGSSVGPDGQYLACATTGDPATKESVLLIVPVAGGEPRELLRVQSPQTFGYCTSWTRDSRSVLFAKQGPNTPSEAWAVDVTGENLRKIDLTVAPVFRLRVHPDGHKVAFDTGSVAREEIWVMENFLETLRTSR